MLDQQQRVDALERRCDELDGALGRALTRIGNLEARANEAQTIPAPPFAKTCEGCGMQACICLLPCDAEGGS